MLCSPAALPKQSLFDGVPFSARLIVWDRFFLHGPQALIQAGAGLVRHLDRQIKTPEQLQSVCTAPKMVADFVKHAKKFMKDVDSVKLSSNLQMHLEAEATGVVVVLEHTQLPPLLQRVNSSDRDGQMSSGSISDSSSIQSPVTSRKRASTVTAALKDF